MLPSDSNFWMLQTFVLPAMQQPRKQRLTAGVNENSCRAQPAPQHCSPGLQCGAGALVLAG